MDIELPYKFTARSYQAEALHALQTDGKKFAVWVWHRRGGKDKTALAGHLIPEMLKRVGNYYHWFPTAALGRKAIWDGKDREGMPFLDHFPKELIASKNEQLMQVKLKNGSIYQIVGTDRMEVVGPGPVGNIFSEYALQSPKGFDYVRPIIRENGGWVIFCYTPRGKNHGHILYKMALTNPKWYCKLLTVDDTHAISKEDIDDDRRSGMSEDMVQQEYYCSFELGAEGAFYAIAMNQALQEGRITNVRYDPHATVYTFWDFGIWGTAIWFVQFIRQEIHLIDYYAWYGQDFEHYATVIEQKKALGYKMEFYAPHDVNKREFATGSTLYQVASDMGIQFHILPKEEVVLHGIQRVLGMLPHCWFDSEKCQTGITTLEQYHKEYNEKFKVYNDQPCHDSSSHGADAFRYISLFWQKGLARTGYADLTVDKIRELNERYLMPVL